MLSGGHALVADFGIARAVTEAGSSQKLTETGIAVGTPLYMSPEQAVGDQVGPTSDLYSLACVLYEMLAGHPPFGGTNARQIMARHAMEQVPSIQVVRDTVPDEVEDAIMAALAKVPADRPQTAALLTEMLTVGLGVTGMAWTATRAAQRRSQARTASTRAITALTQGPESRRRLVLGGAVALTVLLATAVVVWAMRGGRAADQGLGGLDGRHIAVLYFEDQGTKQDLGYLADGLTEGLISALSSVPGLTVVSKGGVAPYRGGTVARDSIARALRVGTLVTGSVEPENDSIRITVRVLDDAGTEMDKTTFKKSGKDLIALADSLTQEAAVLIRKRIGVEARLSQTRSGTQNTNAWAMYQRAAQARGRADSLYKAGDAAGFTRLYASSDSLAGLAEQLDPTWTVPIVLRGQLDYWRSRRATDDPGQANLAIDAGLAHAARALALDKNNADALELRGSLNYWRYLYPLEPDPARRARLFSQSQQDLETATRLNPSAASAYAMLSHLYARSPDKSMADVIFAANKALDADAYLSNADVVISRLTLGYYDLNQSADASKWCVEGRRRFPADPQFVECELLIMTSKFVTNPDPGTAWKLADSVVALTRDERDRRYARLLTRVLVAGVLARAGNRDSARSVLHATKPDPEVDPSSDLANTSAFIWTLVGRYDGGAEPPQTLPPRQSGSDSRLPGQPQLVVPGPLGGSPLQGHRRHLPLSVPPGATLRRVTPITSADPVRGLAYSGAPPPTPVLWERRHNSCCPLGARAAILKYLSALRTTT